MKISDLQSQIEALQQTAHTLLRQTTDHECIYVDDLSLLNQKIYNLLNSLYPQRGKSIEQDASLCLALLMGYSVSMYANPSDDSKRKNVLNRSRKILEYLSPSPLKQELLAVCNEYANS